ncbi:MAG TPA: PilZ domain-containing protein [Geobacteraceae bacterium]
MNYARYLKPRQKIQLLSVISGEHARSEVTTAYVIGCDDERIDLSLPYPLHDADGAPFAPGQEFVIMSDCFGMGLRLSATLEAYGKDATVRLIPRHDLQIFSRRAYPRADVMATVCCMRGKAPLRLFQKHWTAAVKQLAAGKGHPGTGRVKRLTINLSAGGISIPLEAPVREAELCLVFIELDPGLTLWTVGEVVWTKPVENGLQSTGLRFVEITASDQEKVNAFVVSVLQRQGGADAEAGKLKQEALALMEF